MKKVNFKKSMLYFSYIFFFLFLFYPPTVIANDPPHNDASGIPCGECHGEVLFCTDPSIKDPEELRLMYDDVCLRCHKVTENPYHSCSAPLASGHKTVKCIDCHHPHYQTSQLWYGRKYYPSAYEIATGVGSVTGTETIPVIGLLTEISFTFISVKSDWSVEDLASKTSDGRGMLLLPNRNSPYNSHMIYSVTENGNGSGTIKIKGLLSSVSASGFAVAYGQVVNREVPYSSASGEPILFFDSKGEYAFAHNDGLGPGGTDSTANGICQVCHDPDYDETPLRHWLNDGTKADHFSGQNCTKYCHKHTNGFAHGGNGGGENCADCHNSGSHIIHLDNTDPRGPAAFCDACHDLDDMPKFRKLDGSGGHLLAETDICNTCHSPSGTYDGVNDPDLGVKYGNNDELGFNWYNSVYEFVDDTLKLRTGKEKWCATCHDEEPSEIKGVAAPNVIGDEDGDYIYGIGWGYYKTGHGLAAGEQYPSKGNVETLSGRPVECDSCHDYATGHHIDGAARTFDDGDVFGLDPAIYRQGYRLKMIDGQEPYRMPRPSNIGTSADQFRVCFQVGCHDSGPFIDSANMNTNMVTDGTNKHTYHLFFNNQEMAAADWSGAYNSRMTCVICHNVHGSTRLAMVRDGKLINHEPGLRIWYKNDATTYITVNTSNPPEPEDLPLSASDGTAWLASTSSNLCANCHGWNIRTEDRTPFQDVDQAPFLEWVATNGLIFEGVAPDSAFGNSTFTFRVSYSDINNDSPSPIEVWVDSDDNGSYDAGEKYAMAETDITDTNIFNGKNYTKNISIAKAGDGVLNYRFYALDGVLEATGAPTADRAISVLNNAPILAWTGEDFYQADGVNPNNGGNGDTFSFRIDYADNDNEAPSIIQVWIDLDDSNTYDDNNANGDNEKLVMTEVDSGDTTYSDGKLYSMSLSLAWAGDGDLKYRFFAADADDNATGTPTQDALLAVQAGANSPPFMEFVDAGCTVSGVKPQSGATGADFIFTVRYVDPEGQCPPAASDIQLWVDANDNLAYDASEQYDLTEVDAGDTACADGKLYNTSIILTLAGDNALNYRFYATDGMDEAIGEPASDYSVTVVDALKVRPTGGSGWYSAIQSAVDAVNNAHTVLVYDGTYSEDVVFDRFNDNSTTLRSVCGPDTTIINGSGSSSTVTFTRNSGNQLDGFQVTGGTMGIFVSGAHTSVNNCLVHSNSLSGIYAGQNGDMPKLTLTNSEIYNNTSDRGGGVRIWRGSGHIISNSIIRNNTITGNSMADGGGGIHLFQIADIDISNSIIKDNASANIYGGGGLYVSQVPDTTGAGLTVSDSTISGNTTGGHGGGIFSDLSKIKFVRSSITGNTADAMGGALARPSAGNKASFENCILADNQAYQAGMAKLNGGTLDIVNSTIVNNRATDHSGAIYNQLATITIHNSILWGNQAATVGHIAHFNSGSITITDSIIQNDDDGNFTDAPFFTSSGTTVVSGFASEDDPWFVGSGNYHIQAFSPAIDNASATYAPALDIDGQSRPQGAADDIGADEYIP